MIWCFLFLLGLCVGSFINVVVYRLNHSLSPLRGRSVCPKCKHELVWYDNIPLLSFAILRGKCRYCHSPISWQYPLVELGTGVFFVMAYHYFAPQGYIVTLLHCYIVASLLAIFVSDLRYMTIPDKVVYPAIFLTILVYLAGVVDVSTSPPRWPDFHLRGVPLGHLAGVLGSGLAAAGFFYFLVLITRGRGMGMGDVKLAGLMGLLLGWPRIIVALFLAFLTGAGVGVILILLGKKHFGEHVPFGPFLIGGTWVALFWGWVVWEWYWRQMLIL